MSHKTVNKLTVLLHCLQLATVASPSNTELDRSSMMNTAAFNTDCSLPSRHLGNALPQSSCVKRSRMTTYSRTRPENQLVYSVKVYIVFNTEQNSASKLSWHSYYRIRLQQSHQSSITAHNECCLHH